MTERKRDDDPNDPDISRRYRASAREAPSTDTDRHIIEAARAAVSDERRGPRRRTAPIGIAALVLLSATLVVRLADTPREDRSDDASDVATAREAPRSPSREPAALSEETPVNSSAKAAGGIIADTDTDTDTARRAVSAPRSALRERAGEAVDNDTRTADGEGESESDVAPTLDDILTAWEAGDVERARSLLERFTEANPDVSAKTLRQRLPEALLLKPEPEK